MEHSRTVSVSHLALITGILLLGAALRIAPLTDNRMHPDEALFATLGRLIITGQDPWLNQTHLLVDKPPLFYYTTAAGIAVLWTDEMSARLPNLFASIIAIALTYRVARSLWQQQRSAIVSTVLIAVSPFGVAFSPTVFADPQLMMNFINEVSVEMFWWHVITPGTMFWMYQCPICSLLALSTQLKNRRRTI